MAVDADSGTVYCLPEESAEAYPLNRYLYSFAYFRCLFQTERPNYDPEATEEGNRSPAQSLEHMLSEMRRADSMSLGDPESLWRRLLADVVWPGEM